MLVAVAGAEVCCSSVVELGRKRRDDSVYGEAVVILGSAAIAPWHGGDDGGMPGRDGWSLKEGDEVGWDSVM